MSAIVVDAMGWVGAASLLGAYGLVSAHRVHGSSLAYQVPNILGSLLLVVNTVYYGAYPSAALNVVWAAIGAYSLLHPRPSAGRA